MGKVFAVVLAAGNGRRMGGEIVKQYQVLGKKPVICHALAAFEQSVVDRVVLVVSPGMEEYAKNDILGKYAIRKVEAVVPGGRERSDSVYAGMCYLHAKYQKVLGDAIVLIHDGARPFATPGLIGRMVEAAEKDACVIPAVPVKETIKQVRNGFVEGTPDRSMLYSVQTPQAFHFTVLWEAYKRYYEDGKFWKDLIITDDAMLVEYVLNKRVALLEGDYRNIKLTTPEDMLIARAFLAEQEGNQTN
ncbi:MAG: 2-C-methyl-D-erythritol 4-phosphate cytidylyltransferase [Lachnospiraceae bacterium]|nr:2-C-methyl-D-erythritol 4-phosphate cytidylyltransferase [Lachnospiraceae bacterium]